MNLRRENDVKKSNIRHLINCLTLITITLIVCMTIIDLL